MIEIKQHDNQLNVYFKEQLVIKHTDQQPAFFVGQGNETIEHYRGNFEIHDDIESKIPLVDAKVNDTQIVFSYFLNELRVTFTEEEQRLVIKIDSSQPYNRFWIRFYAEKQEKVYGCGEQASYFNLRHRSYPLWTSEPGVGRDKKSLTTFYADLYDKAGGDYYTTYYPEPTFVSTRKYWLHADTYAYSVFNFKNDNYHELFFWEVPKQIMISYQETFLDLIENLTKYTKRPPKLPEFLHNGMILGVQGGMDQVLKYLDQAKKHDVLVSGLWCQDWAGINYTSFGKRLYWNWTVSHELYPNLKQKIKKLDEKNIAFLTYICPFLLENESLFNRAKEQGYLVLNQDDQVYKEDFGEFYCGIVDLTNPKAFHWYKEVIKTNIIDLGIKGWMADFGEYLPVDCKLHNGKDAKLMHNEWPVLWAKCNYEAVKETDNLGKIFYFMRAGGHGSQQYATSLWAGDQSVNWELHDGIASVIPSALSTGIIGNPYTHSDIGGYTSLHGNIRTKELFNRWLEMNVFTSYMRTHEGNRPLQNFQFYNDEDTLSLMARMTHIRYDLKPYILELVDEAHAFGYPLQRALFLHYPNDEKTYDLQYEYLFGKDILIKPVVHPEQTHQEVYLPNDTWVHMWTGKHFEGNQTVTVSCPIGYPPVFYRALSKHKTLFEKITHKNLMQEENV
jgi:alpha-glucosidase